MCGRLIVEYDELIPVATGSELADWVRGQPQGAQSSWNVRPTDSIPIALTSERTRERRFELARWSLTPPWSPTLNARASTFNARSETLATTRTFAPALAHHRCVVLASGFYEWTGPPSARRPFAISSPRGLLAFAGLYGWWRDPAESGSARWHLTATILTRASAGVMAGLHDRMPVVLPMAEIATWLDPNVRGDQQLVDRVSDAARAESALLRAWEVAPLRGDHPGLLQPVGPTRSG